MMDEVLHPAVDEETFAFSGGENWISSIASYFRDFLDTDFKKTTAPKRQITSRDANGVLTGVAVSKYPELAKDIWALFTTPFSADMTHELSVRRGRYRSRLSENLLAVINKHVGSIEEAQIFAIIDAVNASARNQRKTLQDDPERYAEHIVGQLKSQLLIAIVNPLLASLGSFFDKQGNESLETIYNLEEELGDLLIDPLRKPISVAVAAAIIEDDFEELDILIADACETESIRAKLTTYFEAFTTSDFHRDLSELKSTLKLKDNSQLYLYLGALRFGKTSYPLFCFPIEVVLENSIFSIRFDPHFLVNKKAIDFGVSEVSRQIGRSIAFPLADRIIYVGQGQTYLNQAQTIFDDFTSALAMDGGIDLHDAKPQKISRTQISVDNALHFGAFDQSDESLLNDYEELLQELGGTNAAGKEFKSLILGFLSEDPISLEAAVEKEWADTQLPQRLVYDSPVPLNEEQRKILFALNSREGKYVAVEGPPGTGKSHTITAVVFDAILRNKNVLILSDKKEALDVAEHKIRAALKAVRLDENFQDPILRLGKQGNSYAKILAPRTVDQMRQRIHVATARQGELEQEITKKGEALCSRISVSARASTQIDIKEIIAIQRAETGFNFLSDHPDRLLRSERFRNAISAAAALTTFLERSWIADLLVSLGLDKSRSSILSLFDFLRRLSAIADTAHISEPMRAFGRLKVAQLKDLADINEEIQNARKPLIGYLFSGKQMRRLSRRLADEFDHSSPDNCHLQLSQLRAAEKGYRDLIAKLRSKAISEEDQNRYIALLQKGHTLPTSETEMYFGTLSTLLKCLDDEDEELLGDFDINRNDLSGLASSIKPNMVSNLKSLSVHIKRYEAIQAAFNEIPEFDYAGEIRDLQHLHTERLADVLDRRVVQFADEKKNTAAQIKTIIQKKQKFSKDLFADLRNAFPVMIAGIRDYAEYVPLEHDLFDLIIIDEASQVSIAQALPAFLRAKKILVLGDRNQFSNVKTENASKAINQSYKSRIVEQFKAEEKPDLASLNQIKMFDIKTSVLEFVERIANLRIMLRKHFRGYPELIGFSSKYFYGNALQAVKIRGIPIDEVIEFLPIEHDGLTELAGNTNAQEANAIFERLRALAQMESPPDVCIITPFTEQQRFLFENLRKQEDERELTERLRLRIFTFDTCQGEEADVCFYSMVASPLRDRLGYIFASEIEGSDEVEDSIRLQRLNVGFSRAKEKIVILHSKPIEEMKGGIRTALSHFRQTLSRGHEAPEVDDVDANSPMEAEVLNWLRQVPLLEALDDRVEIDAQFEIGAYLKQLDPRYKHPNYKVDFLIKIRGTRETAQIIIEYDGFKEHFENLDDVNAANFEFYMRGDDIERQKVLEGYGYKFIRINRFNIGEDPIKALDGRFRKILANFDIERELPTVIQQRQKLQQSLNDGEAKACSRCQEIRPMSDFFDAALKRGEGGYGRVCQTCKGADKAGTKERYAAAVATLSKDRIYLKCPFAQREDCKKLGGRWDQLKKKWYVPPGLDPAPFSKWISR